MGVWNCLGRDASIKPTPLNRLKLGGACTPAVQIIQQQQQRLIRYRGVYSMARLKVLANEGTAGEEAGASDVSIESTPKCAN